MLAVTAASFSSPRAATPTAVIAAFIAATNRATSARVSGRMVPGIMPWDDSDEGRNRFLLRHPGEGRDPGKRHWGTKTPLLFSRRFVCPLATAPSRLNLFQLQAWLDLRRFPAHLRAQARG